VLCECDGTVIVLFDCNSAGIVLCYCNGTEKHSVNLMSLEICGVTVMDWN
jgi:hypothetical protein